MFTGFARSARPGEPLWRCLTETVLPLCCARRRGETYLSYRRVAIEKWNWPTNINICIKLSLQPRKRRRVFCAGSLAAIPLPVRHPSVHQGRSHRNPTCAVAGQGILESVVFLTQLRKLFQLASCLCFASESDGLRATSLYTFVWKYTRSEKTIGNIFLLMNTYIKHNSCGNCDQIAVVPWLCSGHVFSWCQKEAIAVFKNSCMEFMLSGTLLRFAFGCTPFFVNTCCFPRKGTCDVPGALTFYRQLPNTFGFNAFFYSEGDSLWLFERHISGCPGVFSHVLYFFLTLFFTVTCCFATTAHFAKPGTVATSLARLAASGYFLQSFTRTWAWPHFAWNAFKCAGRGRWSPLLGLTANDWSWRRSAWIATRLAGSVTMRKLLYGGAIAAKRKKCWKPSWTFESWAKGFHLLSLGDVTACCFGTHRQSA